MNHGRKAVTPDADPLAPIRANRAAVETVAERDDILGADARVLLARAAGEPVDPADLAASRFGDGGATDRFGDASAAPRPGARRGPVVVDAATVVAAVDRVLAVAATPAAADRERGRE